MSILDEFLPCGEPRPLSVADQLAHYRACRDSLCMQFWFEYRAIVKAMVRDGAQVKERTS